jgi:hypothetical protein
VIIRLCVAALLAASLAAAQGKKGGSKNNVDDLAMVRPQQVRRFDAIADRLRLNKEQREQATAFFDAAQEAAAPLNEEIANGRTQITTAFIQGQNSGEGFDKLMAAYTAVLGQMAGVEATAYGKLYAILKPNQQSKAAQVFAEQMTGMFAGRDWKRMR